MNWRNLVKAKRQSKVFSKASQVKRMIFLTYKQQLRLLIKTLKITRNLLTF